MKFNEPISPKGIGRSQVAFNLPVNGQIVNITEQEESDDSTQVNLQDAVSRSTALSRVIAYSAASSAIANNYAEPFGLAQIKDFTINHAGPSNWSQATVTFKSDYVFKYGPENANYFLSADGSTIKVNRSGWYQVQAMLYIGDHHGNHVYMLKAYSEEQIDQVLHGGDYVETNDYPTLRLSQLVPVIGFDLYKENKPNISAIESGGFKLDLFIYGLSNDITITNANSQLWLQAIWLAPLRNSITLNPS
jgi:uncharacterized membrane protein